MGLEGKRGAIITVFACLALVLVFIKEPKQVLVFFERQQEIAKEPAAQPTHEPNVATITEPTDRPARVPMCSLVPPKGKRRKTSTTSVSSALSGGHEKVSRKDEKGSSHRPFSGGASRTTRLHLHPKNRVADRVTLTRKPEIRTARTT